MTFSPDGRRVLAGTEEGVVYLWDVQTGKELRRYEGQYVAISPNGRQALSGPADGSVRLWKLPEPDAPFVLLGARGAFERTFATLADAVQGASDGDTIEIRGNGPFETAPIDLKVKALTIRAGEGYRPHLRHQPTDPKSIEPVLTTSGRLVLEGLILERGANPGAKLWLENSAVVNVHGAPFRLANCRVVGHRVYFGLNLYRVPEGVVTNCEILGDECFIAIHFAGPVSSRLRLENNLIAFKVTGLAVAFPSKKGVDEFQDAVVSLHHNTIWAVHPLGHHNFGTLDLAQLANPKMLRLEAAGNIMAGEYAFAFPIFDKSVALKDAVPFLPKLLSFRDEDNLYDVRSNAFLRLGRALGQEPFQTINSLRERPERTATHLVRSPRRKPQGDPSG